MLELEGWPPSTDTTDGDHRLLVYDGKEGDCRIAVDRWWGQPPRPGGPMMIASRKAIAIDGREFELLETSAFDGVERVVQVVFHGNDAFQVRVVFAECAPATVAKALDLIRILR